MRFYAVRTECQQGNTKKPAARAGFFLPVAHHAIQLEQVLSCYLVPLAGFFGSIFAISLVPLGISACDFCTAKHFATMTGFLLEVHFRSPVDLSHHRNDYTDFAQNINYFAKINYTCGSWQARPLLPFRCADFELESTIDALHQ
jgi:hypothetical protein